MGAFLFDLYQVKTERKIWKTEIIVRIFVSMEYVVQSPNKVIFTEREVQVIREYADGKSVAQIASGLEVTVRTVESYMAQIRTKLGVGSTVQVVAAFFRNKIIE